MISLLVLSAFTLLSVGARSAAVEWSAGKGLWVYAQIQLTGDVTCPPTQSGADSNKDLCRVFAKDGKVFCSKTPGVAGRRVLNLNGFVTGKGPMTQATRLKVVERDSPTGDGCLSVTQNDDVIVTPCKLADGSQKLFLSPLVGNDGGYTLYTDHDSKPLSVGPGDALVATKEGYPIFCLYEADGQGNAVIPPSKDTAYFPPDQVNALAGIALPGPKDFRVQKDLPGCKDEKVTTPDCLIATAINGMPPGCPENPGSRRCVLHLVGPFCSDVPEFASGNDNSALVEFCFRRIALGPCVANAAGRACASGQFAGIAKFGDDGGHIGHKHKRAVGGVTNLARRENYGSDRDLWNDQPDMSPLEDQFWKGAMTNIINGFVDFLNAFRSSLFRSSQISCLAMTQKFSEGTEKGDQVRKGCTELFKEHKPVPSLPLHGEVEKAGSVFADVVSALYAVGDVVDAVKAAKFVGAGGVRNLLNKFKPRLGTAAEGVEGYVLEAKEGGNTVQIFRDGGDGQPVGIKNDQEYKDLRESIGQDAFQNCFTCADPIRRLIKRKEPSKYIKFCCGLKRRRNDDPVGNEFFNELPQNPPNPPDPNIEPPPDRFLDPIRHGNFHTDFGVPTNPARIVDTSGVLPKMTDEFARWFANFEDIPVEADDVTKGWFDRISATDDSVVYDQIASEFREKYHVTDEEALAMTDFMESSIIDEDAFKSVVPKLPPVQGFVRRVTELDEETVNMLINGEPGLVSKGPRGVYEVRDLVINRAASPGAGKEPPRLVLSSSLGFRNDYNPTGSYRMVINSRYGRYISPLDPSFEQYDVVHLQGSSGPLQMLAYQPLNGGEAGRLAGRNGPHGVFYFNEASEASGSGGGIGGGGHGR